MFSPQYCFHYMGAMRSRKNGWLLNIKNMLSYSMIKLDYSILYQLISDVTVSMSLSPMKWTVSFTTLLRAIVIIAELITTLQRVNQRFE